MWSVPCHTRKVLTELLNHMTPRDSVLQTAFYCPRGSHLLHKVLKKQGLRPLLLPDTELELCAMPLALLCPSNGLQLKVLRARSKRGGGGNILG